MELDIQYSGYYSTEVCEVCEPFEEGGKLVVGKVITEE